MAMSVVEGRKPMMADCEIEIMDSILETQQPRWVLEFGAGVSTLHWPERCPSVVEWRAIECQKKWYEKLEGKVHPKVRLELRSRKDYFWPILECAKGFDLILVDGIYRQACMVVAAQKLAPRGIVVLHDAGRPEYLPAWGVFPHHEVLYPGELPRSDGKGFRHRGLAVFWRDRDVRREGWCRDHIV